MCDSAHPGAGQHCEYTNTHRHSGGDRYRCWQANQQFSTLVKDQRGLCEEALLRVKGVISFTFQMASKRCTVRIRSDLPTEVTDIYGQCPSVRIIAYIPPGIFSILLVQESQVKNKTSGISCFIFITSSHLPLCSSFAESGVSHRCNKGAVSPADSEE